MNVIAHYLSTAFKKLDPEVAVPLYSKNSIVLQLLLSLQSQNGMTHYSFIKIWLPSPIKETPHMFNRFSKLFLILKHPLSNIFFSFLTRRESHIS